MSGSFSNYLEAKILDHITGKTSYTKPTAYLALFTAITDGEAGTVTEPTIGQYGYARVQTAGTDWNAAASGAVSNAKALSFPQCTGTQWGTIVGFGVYDAASGGNLLAYGTLGTQKSIGVGDTASFAAGQLTITLD
jgi:hypothetical protein